MDDGLQLSGLTIGITADRRGEDQAVMFRRLGAEVVVGPTLQTISVPDGEVLRERTEDLIADPPAYLIATTGIGIRTWMAHAAGTGQDERLKAALGRGRIAARGPKAAGAVTMAGMEVWWRAPGEQLAEVASHLVAQGLEGQKVALQMDGNDHREVITRLEVAGAQVSEIPVYRWAKPDHADGALRLIDLCCRGEIDAVTFTAGPQVRNMFELADSAGQSDDLRAAFNGPTIVGCIGPVCAGVAREEGISHPLVPANWRLGSLVKSVAEALAERGESTR